MVKVFFIDTRKFDDKTFLSEALDCASLFRKKKYDSFKFDSSKKQSIAATYIVNYYLKSIGLLEKEMEYDLNKFGKPSFKMYPNIKFSISHSNNLAMVGFSDIDIGCDVEKIDKFDEKLIDKVLSDTEKAVFNKEPSIKEKTELFYKYWVMKEAILKKTGTGLVNSLREIHDDRVYIGEKILSDIGEKYYFAVFDGISNLANLSINVL